LLLCLGSLSAQPQAGVPSGEPTTAMGSAVITVVDSTGAVVPRASVTIENAFTGASRSAFTDDKGELRVAQLPPGTYQVIVTVPGFVAARQSFGISAGAAQRMTIRLALGGPVPGGEPSAATPVPAPAAGVTVVEKDFSDDLSLQSWLNQQAANKTRLVAVVPLQDKKSWFVMTQVSSDPPANLVLSVGRALQADDLQRRISSVPNETFVGIHRLGNDSYLMVFRAGP
jgi:hypothetical protein